MIAALPAQSLDLSSIENMVISLISQGLMRDWLATFVKLTWLMKSGIGYRLETARNELPISVIQAQFDSMPDRVWVVLVTMGDSCLY